MSIARPSENPFDSLLAAVNRPTAPSSSRSAAEPAAEAFSSEASAALFSRMTESSPIAARSGQDAPAGTGATVPAGALSIELSPAVALILSLAMSAKRWSADDVIAKAIVLFAQDIGVPSLVTEIEARKASRHANSESADLHGVPRFERRAPSRFEAGRFKPFNRGE